MSTLILILLACGGDSTAPSPGAEAPAPVAIVLEDFMQTCMGKGDCTVVATGCCDQDPVAVNNANADQVKRMGVSGDQCANVRCAEPALPAVECKAAKCVLAE